MVDVDLQCKKRYVVFSLIVEATTGFVLFFFFPNSASFISFAFGLFLSSWIQNARTAGARACESFSAPIVIRDFLPFSCSKKSRTEKTVFFSSTVRRAISSKSARTSCQELENEKLAQTLLHAWRTPLKYNYRLNSLPPSPRLWVSVSGHRVTVGCEGQKFCDRL